MLRDSRLENRQATETYHPQSGGQPINESLTRTTLPMKDPASVQTQSSNPQGADATRGNY